MRTTDRPLSGEDRISIAILAFFLIMAFSIELYFIINFNDITRQTDLFGQAYKLYGRGDAAYYGQGFTALPLALESTNVFAVQIFNGLLIWAIVRRRRYRYPLQLALSAYVAALVILYLWTAHVSGYAGMAERTFWNFFILYAPNMPWFVGYLFLVHRSFVPILRRFSEATPEAGSSIEGSDVRLPA